MKTFYSKKGERLSKEILNECSAELTYSAVMKILRKKDVKINGKRVSSDEKTAIGDEITIYFSAPERRVKELYKCDDILAAYKPKGITSEDFYALVKSVYPSAFFTHRLDRNTDGIMLFALNQTAYEELYEGFKNRTFDKYYVAEVYGKPPKEKDELTAYLKKDDEKSLVRISATPKTGYEKIVTEYEVISSSDKTSVLRVKLITGKTHQIRAHLAFIGCPIIGDGKYGDNAINKRFGDKYQRLTASEIVLRFFPSSPLYRLNGTVVKLYAGHQVTHL